LYFLINNLNSKFDLWNLFARDEYQINDLSEWLGMIPFESSEDPRRTEEKNANP